MSYYENQGNKYKREPDFIIDLHGMNRASCQEELRKLFSSDYSHVRIIVGKGTRSKSGPVLPDCVKSYLNEEGIRYERSKIQDGGEGALEVYF